MRLDKVTALGNWRGRGGGQGKKGSGRRGDLLKPKSPKAQLGAQPGSEAGQETPAFPEEGREWLEEQGAGRQPNQNPKPT